MSKPKFNIKLAKQKFSFMGTTRCEMCNSDSWLSFAHRKKRRHYTDNSINSLNEILLLCVPCHQILEKSPTLTVAKFKELRG